MNVSQHFSAALRTLLSSRMRSLLSSLGIVIGVFSVTVLLAFGEGTRQGILSSVQSLGTNLLTVTPGGSAASRIGGGGGGLSSRNVLTTAESDLIAKLPGVAAVSSEVSGNKQAIAGSKNTSVSVIGVTPAYATVHSIKTQAGLFVSASDIASEAKVAVLGAAAILTPTFGWQSASFAAAATVGAPVESDAALRQRQAASTGLPSTVTPKAAMMPSLA